MKKWMPVLLVMLLSATVSLADAGQLATLGVTNQSTGERLEIWRHGGRNYVAGNPGDRYAIELNNQTDGRLLSVISVDGVNVISGATASTGQSGYVLDGRQRLEIRGWRKSMDDVASFYFTRLPDSYAARTGRAENVGVIGVALFREYVEPVVLQDQSERSVAVAPRAEALAKSAARADNAIGTGHGERVSSASSITQFRRATEAPGEIISIYYDTHTNLVARGIIPASLNRSPGPVPFPGNFVPDPS